MTFADLLRQYIGDRTLDEMSRLCAQRGFQLDSTYISKLRTGSRPAPEDPSVVRCLAEVCGRDPEPLLLLALYERNPREVMEQLIDSFVHLQMEQSRLEDELINELAVLRTMIDTGVARGTMLKELFDTKEYRGELIANLAKHRTHLREMLELLSDPQRLEEAEGGTRGTLLAPKPKQPVELVEELAQAVGVPAVALHAAIAAAKSVKGL